MSLLTSGLATWLPWNGKRFLFIYWKTNLQFNFKIRWTDLWLNEGFANFIEYLCVDKLFPEFNIWNQFVCKEIMRALKVRVTL